MDPEDQQAQPAVDAVTGADPAPGCAPVDDAHVMSADEAYRNFIAPVGPASPAWRQPITLGPDPSTLGQPGAAPNPILTPIDGPPALAPSTSGGPLLPLADHAPSAATSLLGPGPNLGGGFKLPPWAKKTGVGGTVGGQDLTVAPALSTSGTTHDLDKPASQ
jgi:hypothetical protein